jgi:hypothetical protein
MGQGIVALVGVFVGASAAIAGGVALEAYRRCRDRQGTASAFAGEISSIFKMTARRNHVATFTNILARLKAGTDVEIPRITQGRDYRDPVADRFLDKLGLLPGDIPERTVQFYSMLSGVRLDIERMADKEFDRMGKISIIEEDLEIWQDAAKDAEILVADLRRAFGSPCIFPFLSRRS